ncbi:unnamed protein product [Pleuronectes platessa]|uniref:Uncharacterized protein n=1 Tax=Pleuronectes platessa TaxID=8262 RepID=A0A9N7TQL6_PLEPL|nr:unnamed protein product [Pleuronectes platessa]
MFLLPLPFSLSLSQQQNDRLEVGSHQIPCSNPSRKQNLSRWVSEYGHGDRLTLQDISPAALRLPDVELCIRCICHINCFRCHAVSHSSSSSSLVFVDPWLEGSSSISISIISIRRGTRIHPGPNCPSTMVAVRLVACLSLLAGVSLQVDVKSAKDAGKAGNFMEDEQWLSTISQYSRKLKHWNRFRDVSGVF